MAEQAYAGDPRVSYSRRGDGSPPDVPALIYPDRIPANGAFIVREFRGRGFVTELAVPEDLYDRQRSDVFASADAAIAALIGPPQVMVS